MGRLIISVQEARKILGSSSMGMTDEDVGELILNLDDLARLYFKAVREGKIKIPPK